MNEQTAVDIAEAILPETETVANSLQSALPFAFGVAVGAAGVAGVAYLVVRRQNAKSAPVVVPEPTV